MAKYQDGCIEIETTDNQVQIHQTSDDFYVTLSFYEADQLLELWNPYMKYPGYFVTSLRGNGFRSYDIKSVVRILRKVVKNRV